MGTALARLLVRLAARLAPRQRRERFVREWDAELWHETPREGAPGRGGSVRTALGSFRDARTLREIEHRARGRARRTTGGTMGDWAREARLAARGLTRNPGFTAVAVLTLALGIGGAGAIYTLLERVVLDPLPYPESARLVQLQNQVPGVGPDERWSLSTAQYVYFTDHVAAFESVALYRGLGGNVETPEGPRRVFGWRVTHEIFPLLGGRAQVGRLLGADDDRPGAPVTVVLSDGFWERQFGADPGVIGSTVTLNGQPLEVVGVLEPGFAAPEGPPGVTADVWIPLQIDRQGTFYNSHVFPGVARLAPGVDPAAAERAVAEHMPRLPETFPQAYDQEFFDRYGFRTVVTPLKEAVVGEDLARNLWILFGGVGLVLLVALANVVNLFVVRMEGRSQEMAVRSAMGAGRGAIARFLLAEGMALSLAGGLLAVLVGFWGVPALVGLAPESIPRLEGVSLDGSSVAFTLGLSALVGLALAAYPLLRHSAVDLASLAAGSSRGSSAGWARQRFRSLMVVAQVAMALTLAVGAGLLVESIRRLAAVDAGIEADGVLTMEVHLTPSSYETDVEVWGAWDAMLERIRAIPGVEEAGMSAALPLDGFGCTVQGFEDASVADRIEAAGMTVCAGQTPTTPGYFEAMGIPVLEGRGLTDADMDDPGRASVVVSRAFAERFWPGESALGKGVAPSGRTIPPFYRVVGVVGDVPAGSLDGEPAIAVYYPVVKDPDTPGRWGWWKPTSMDLVVKAGIEDASSLFPAVREAVRSVDPTAPVEDAREMEAVLAESTSRFTFMSVLLGVAAAVALLLAGVGLYGVMSWVVSRRTREIGMRMAIGARPGEVQRQVLGRAMGLVALGLALGVAAALALGGVLEGLLFGVEPSDPRTYALAAALLAAVAALASWLPARRASRVDPAEALRAE